jgi:hypothetical protein
MHEMSYYKLVDVTGLFNKNAAPKHGPRRIIKKKPSLQVQPNGPSKSETSSAISIQNAIRRFLCIQEFRIQLALAAAAAATPKPTRRIIKKKKRVITATAEGGGGAGGPYPAQVHEVGAPQAPQTKRSCAGEIVNSLFEGSCSKECSALNNRFQNALYTNDSATVKELITHPNVHPAFKNYDGLSEAASKCHYNVTKLVLDYFSITTDTLTDLQDEARESGCAKTKVSKFMTLFK